MKKNVIALMMGAAMMIGFASCSDDQELSINMSGEWNGNFGSYYTTLDRNDNERTYYADETYMRFIPDHTYATHGRGTQVDYYDRGPYESMYYQFDWDVENERIYLTYPGYPEMDMVISYFEMDDRHFSGRCGGSSFTLWKIADYYDWSPYDRGHGYCSRANYDTRSGVEEEEIISRGNINK